MKKTSGFTLIEVMISAGILVLILVGTLNIFTYSLTLTEVEGYLNKAQYEVERQMEQISADDYLTIRTTYTNAGALKETPFGITGLTGMGTVYAEELPGAADGLMRIKVVVCFRQRDRLIGEDKDLDGILDSSEDTNSNGELDSLCQTETVVVNKEL